jgi:hypothetical protein
MPDQIPRQRPHLTLTPEQREEYLRLKNEILQDLHTALNALQQAGRKLLYIRDNRLYREEYLTFEEFCRSIFGMSKTYANNLIIAYNVLHDLASHDVSILPDNERVARELAKYPRVDRKMIWIRALQIAEKGRLKRPTYKMIHEASKDTLPAHPKVRDEWFGQFKRDIQTAKKLLSGNFDLETLTYRQRRELAVMLAEIADRVQLLGEKIGRDAFEGIRKPRMGGSEGRDYG